MLDAIVNVLVIEDDRVLCDLIETILRRKHLSVQTSARGDAALSAIESGTNQYDAILLDLMLPGANGFELLRHIHTNNPALLSRIIVLTAASSMVLTNLEFSSLVWHVMRKPFDLDDLLGTLFACIECHSGLQPPEAPLLSRWLQRKSAIIGARAGLVAVRHDRTLQLRAEFGFPPALTASAFPLSVDSKYPLTIAFTSRRPVWLAPLNVWHADFPLLLPLWTANDSQALAALPIAQGDVAIGAIGWVFDQPQAFDEPMRRVLSNIATDCYSMLTRSPGAISRAQPQA